MFRSRLLVSVLFSTKRELTPIISCCAYRPERSALDAVGQVERLLRSGHTEVVDADLSGYFDSIPHAEFMKSVSRRISDGRVLRLIKMWLEAPVEETDTKGNRHRTTRNPEETFDFLGYTLGRNYDCRTGESYLGPRPARKKVDRLCSAINELTTRRKAWRDVEELIGRIHHKLRGWSNDFRIGTVSKAYRNINSHTRYRVRQWLCAKFKEIRCQFIILARKDELTPDFPAKI
jgi:hypothetical protein